MRTKHSQVPTVYLGAYSVNGTTVGTYGVLRNVLAGEVAYLGYYLLSRHESN